MTDKLNIYQKLVEVRKQVTYLKKSSQGYKFQYVDIQDLLIAIRPKMDELNILFEFDMEDFRETDKIHEESLENKKTGEVKTSKTPIYEVKFVFTFVDADNPKDKIEKKIFLMATSPDPKTLGGLMSYAQRYFLFKYFNIATGYDDPDNIQVEMERKKESELSDENVNGKISEKQVKVIMTMIGKDKNMLENVRARCPNNDLNNLEADRFQKVINFIEESKK